MKAFRLFTDGEYKKIRFEDLKRVAKELGENLTDEELREMVMNLWIYILIYNDNRLKKLIEMEIMKLVKKNSLEL